MTRKAPKLEDVLAELEAIAPPELAAEWDNVGLLVSPPRTRGMVCPRVMLTIDATPEVVSEALRQRASLLVGYHPPIFTPLRALDADEPLYGALREAWACGLAIYSPHTALDAAPGGLADWIARGVAPKSAASAIEACGEGGFGRIIRLREWTEIGSIARRCKRLFGVRHLGAAFPPRRRAIRTIAVAAGAGASVLRGAGADLYVTGEMSHHDALAAVRCGTAVILAGHSNTERGYLPVLRDRLLARFGDGLLVAISARDKDPLSIL
ncbi:MAG: Nif3-like dinuclear metal center hexameric protein [Planctomycetota bacterium]